MSIIQLSTFIDAPPERCFDLCRSIDLLCDSTNPTLQQPLEAPVSGLVVEGQLVELRAKQLGFRWWHRSRITLVERATHFQDIQVTGPFRSFTHDHWFFPTETGTRMDDFFTYEVPFSIIGHLADSIFGRKRLQRLLEDRNRKLKAVAESDDWKTYL